jgi:hypothetical protein
MHNHTQEQRLDSGAPAIPANISGDYNDSHNSLDHTQAHARANCICPTNLEEPGVPAGPINIMNSYTQFQKTEWQQDASQTEPGVLAQPVNIVNVYRHFQETEAQQEAALIKGQGNCVDC